MEKFNKSSDNNNLTVVDFFLNVSYVLFLFKLGSQIYFINNLPYWLILMPMLVAICFFIFHIVFVLINIKELSSVTFSGGSSVIHLTMFVMLLLKFGGMESLNSVSYWWFFIALFFIKQSLKINFR